MGIARALMSTYGYRGPFVDFIFTGVRLCVDQSLENWTGAGSPPWTWPVSEQVIDVLHKGVFACVTGFVRVSLPAGADHLLTILCLLPYLLPDVSSATGGFSDDEIMCLLDERRVSWRRHG